MNDSASSISAGFRLGDLRVQPATGMVIGPGGEIRLEPRVMAVLEALANRSRQLVPRTELLESIWPGGEVYDEALTQCVYQLRQQLLSAGGGEDYRNLITTVPKRGYVLNSEVLTLPAVPETPVTSRGFGRMQRIVAVAAVLAVALGLAWSLSRRGDTPSPETPAQPERTIAVLPFLPLVAGQSEPELEMGMADTLIARLSNMGELVVRPMSSVRRYNDLERDSLQAGRQLGAETVLDGSLQRHEGTLRVTVRLVRVADGRALWAETINEPFSNIFRVQDQISERIATALSLQFGQDERRRMAKGGTDDTEAYEHYMQGRYHLARLTPGDLREAVAQFRAAVEIDPQYTQAWLGLANVQFRLPVAGEGLPQEYYPRALEAAQRALELDPNSAEAYAMLGWIAHWYQWDWAASEAHFKHAIELNPNDTESHLGYAHLLTTTGRYQEAMVEGRRARELSPNYMLAAALEGGWLVRSGKREEALRQLQAARAVGENLWLFRVTLAAVYKANGRPEDALAEYEQARQLSGGSTWVMANEIDLLRDMGRDSEAKAMFAELLRQSEIRYVPAYDLSTAYRAMGDLESALASLERALELHDPKLVFITQGVWNPLRDRPRFQRIEQALNLPAAPE